jgi:HEAT repeat protein
MPRSRTWTLAGFLALFLASCGPDTAELTARLRTGAPEQRRQAAEALGQRGNHAAVVALCAALAADPESAVRTEAARAIGRVGGPDGIGCLMKTLGEDDLHTQLAAVEALAAIGRLAAFAMLDSLPRTQGIVRDKLAAAAGSVGEPRAVEPLLDLLHRADGAETGAARGLVALGYPHLLVPFLSEPPDSPSRRAAARALKDARDPASLAALERALIRLDGGLDLEVALALARRHKLTPLIQVLDSNAPAAHRRVAAQALATSPRRSAEQALDRAVARRDLAAVAGAHVRLIRMGRPETEGLLVAALAAGGDETMALRFWECGNPALRAAAEAWLEAHGHKDAHYVILPGGAPREPEVRWGRP